ncbi:hypothetical protein YC2023_109859 [Brassica napus]
MDEKLSVMELLKRAAKLLFSNISLAFLLFLCSLPLSLSKPPSPSLTSSSSKNSILAATSFSKIIKISSSVAYTSEEEDPLGMVCLVQRSAKICQNRLVGCLITLLYVLLLSTSVFFGFFSDSVNYLFIASLSRDYESFHSKAAVLFHAVVYLIHGTIFIVLAVKFGKWSAVWNMGLVVSVLEEEEGEDGKGCIYGTNALSLSYWYGRGHEKRDLLMMLMFLVFAIATRMPCLYSRCSLSGNGVLYTGVYVGLICVGNVVKWVACVVSYYDCRARVLEKKDDVEIGSKAKGFAT